MNVWVSVFQLAWGILCFWQAYIGDFMAPLPAIGTCVGCTWENMIVGANQGTYVPLIATAPNGGAAPNGTMHVRCNNDPNLRGSLGGPFTPRNSRANIRVIVVLE